MVAVVAEEFRTFGEVLRDLLVERKMVTPIGNPNWSEFAREVAGVHYETLRKAVTGDRRALPELMRSCAEALGVEPEVFPEYRLWEVQRQFDPREVGSDAAMANLAEWAAAHKKKS